VNIGCRYRVSSTECFVVPLCVCAAAGRGAKDFKAAADAAGLALTLDDTSRGMRQALSGKGMSNIVGYTGGTCKAYWHCGTF